MYSLQFFRIEALDKEFTVIVDIAVIHQDIEACRTYIPAEQTFDAITEILNDLNKLIHTAD